MVINMWKCPKCETINDDSDPFCVVCDREKSQITVKPPDTSIEKETNVVPSKINSTIKDILIFLLLIAIGFIITMVIGIASGTIYF